MADKEIKVHCISMVIKRMACYNICQADTALIKEWSLKIHTLDLAALLFVD